MNTDIKIVTVIIIIAYYYLYRPTLTVVARRMARTIPGIAARMYGARHP